jgi:hypothetical protein
MYLRTVAYRPITLFIYYMNILFSSNLLWTNRPILYIHHTIIPAAALILVCSWRPHPDSSLASQWKVITESMPRRAGRSHGRNVWIEFASEPGVLNGQIATAWPCHCCIYDVQQTRESPAHERKGSEAVGRIHETWAHKLHPSSRTLTVEL